ncbi:uncharacterized protein BYT42DRAFT_9107 [Radiomyces spectabilis]|uniref:uncharacterized protein n=1 Tax=Radiomyces spectabilis TaxID=64574 RepID=UPI00221FF0AE|nr:uncharacterized protein BYT42DRAFT_9107 [Radiomyces spectabilis]KAI8393503.1 hypothetical protein BYT42DRAFT_9107 [Radiomyces spectabilis]
MSLKFLGGWIASIHVFNPAELPLSMTDTCMPPSTAKFRLTTIYSALRLPNKQASEQCQKDLRTAPLPAIDAILRRLLAAAKHPTDQWPMHRLLRCLDYIFVNRIKSQTQPIGPLLKLASFRGCVRFSIRQLDHGDTTYEPSDDNIRNGIQAASKFLYNLLECLHKIEDAEDTTGVLTDIRRLRAIMHLLHWTSSSIRPIRHYCLRALSAHANEFPDELIEQDAFWILSRILGEIPDELVTFFQQGDESRKSLLDDHLKASRLLDSLTKPGEKKAGEKVHGKMLAFAESVSFVAIVRGWESLCTCHQQLEEKLHDEGRLICSLTSIISKYTALSPNAAYHVASIESQRKWMHVLVLEMRKLATHLAQTPFMYLHTDTAENPPRQIQIPKPPTVSVYLIKRLMQIAISIANVIPENSSFFGQMVIDITNLLQVFVCQPMRSEYIQDFGTMVILSNDIRVDAEARGSNVNNAMLQQYEGLLIILLETFIQYVQHTPSDHIAHIAGPVAFCLKSLLTILWDEDILDQSPLRGRLERLTVYFLHYNDAIDVLATAHAGLNPYIWKPTIQHAIAALELVNTIQSSNDIPRSFSIVYKAKRALIALETISRHPRAYERILDGNVLNIIDVATPKSKVMFESTDIFKMFALFVRFIASMAEKTAVVRTRLRTEHPIIPVVMHLLLEAINHRSGIRAKQKTSDQTVWDTLIIYSFEIVHVYKYDTPSLQQWIVWTNDKNDCEDIIPWFHHTVEEDEKQCSPLVSVLLSALFPWMLISDGSDADVNYSQIQSFWKEDCRLMTMASTVFEDVCGIPDFGQQLMQRRASMHYLAKLLCYLSCEDLETVYMDIDTNISVPEAAEEAIKVDDAWPTDDCDAAPDSVDSNPVPHASSRYNDASIDTDSHLKAAHSKQCFGALYRGLIRMLGCKENVKYTVLKDVFTILFKPLLAYDEMDGSKVRLRQALGTELSSKNLQRYQRLFDYTEDDDDAIRLHELTAVAIGYANLSPTTWEYNLGVRAAEGIVYSKSVFGILCHMLVYDLEYASDFQVSSQRTMTTENPTLAPLGRRHAAAQVIEALAQTLNPGEESDLAEMNRDMVTLKCNSPTIMDDRHTNNDMTVSFVTPTSTEPIYGQRSVLVRQSAMFEALLSNQYAENTADSVMLQNVQHDSLVQFFRVVEAIDNQRSKHLDLTLIFPRSIGWRDVIDLLQLSDQYGSDNVRLACEQWIFNQLQQSPLCCHSMEGSLLLYRRCRSPMDAAGGIHSDTWPFRLLLRVCLTFILSHLSAACSTDEFKDMVQTRNNDELDTFCDAIAAILSHRSASVSSSFSLTSVA